MDFIIESDFTNDAYFRKLKWVLLPVVLLLLGVAVGYYAFHNSMAVILLPLALITLLTGAAWVRARQFRASLRNGMLMFEYSVTMRSRSYGLRYEPMVNQVMMPASEFFGYEWNRGWWGMVNDLYVIRKVNGELLKSKAISLSGLATAQKEALIAQLEVLQQNNKQKRK